MNGLMAAPGFAGTLGRHPARTSALGFAVPALTVVALVVTAGYPDPNVVGGLGLITVIPEGVIACALALSVSFVLTLRAAHRQGAPSRLGWWVLAAHVAALLLVTHGIAALLQAEPRFATAWLHVGFVDSLVVEQHPLANVDARFSWPGFFSGSGAFIGAAGFASAIPLLRLAPLVSNVLCLLPLTLLARTFVPSRTGRWLVVWLFVLCNWVGQDYFSPQGLAYFLMLSIAAILTLAFSRPPEGPSRLAFATTFVRQVAWLVPLRASVRIDAQESKEDRAPAVEIGALITILVGFTAMVMSHQLTPVVLVVDVLALVILRRCSAMLLPLAMAVILLGWISYAAVDFWSGHLQALVGGGSVGGAVGENVSQRIKGSTDHYVVIAARLGFAAAVWLLAAFGALRVVRSGSRLPLAAVALALAPFPILAVQSYGGEAPLRVYLYTLPFMLIIGARAFVPRVGAILTARASALFIVAALIATPLFYVTRYGNEAFEQVRPGEVTAISWLYDSAPRGSTLVSVNGNVPWRYREFTAYDYRSLDSATTTDAVLSALSTNTATGATPVYVLVTKGQGAYAAEAYGLTTLVDDVSAALSGSTQYEKVYSNADATIFRYRGST